MRILIIPLTITILVIGCLSKQEAIEKPSKPYPEILIGLDTQRAAYKSTYENATTEGKQETLQKVHDYLFYQLTQEIFPSWYATPWDFNGITQTPKKGHIACGYFVTTTLRDLGLKIPRIKWAQAASEKMILSATQSVKRFSGASMQDVQQWLLSQEDAIYIVGLDNHTGFVVKQGQKLLFVDSSPYNKGGGVGKQNATNTNLLTKSKYRIFGKLFEKDMLIAWLYQKEYSI